MTGRAVGMMGNMAPAARGSLAMQRGLWKLPYIAFEFFLNMGNKFRGLHSQPIGQEEERIECYTVFSLLYLQQIHAVNLCHISQLAFAQAPLFTEFGDDFCNCFQEVRYIFHSLFIAES